MLTCNAHVILKVWCWLNNYFYESNIIWQNQPKYTLMWTCSELFAVKMKWVKSIVLHTFLLSTLGDHFHLEKGTGSRPPSDWCSGRAQARGLWNYCKFSSLITFTSIFLKYWVLLIIIWYVACCLPLLWHNLIKVPNFKNRLLSHPSLLESHYGLWGERPESW